MPRTTRTIDRSSANLLSPRRPPTCLHSLVEEQRIVRPRAVDQPPHGGDHILPGRDLSRVPRIVGQDDDVLLLIPKPITQELDHVVRIVDAPCERLRGADVVAPDGERFPLAVTLRVLEIGLLFPAGLPTVLKLRAVELITLRRPV